MTFPEIEIKWPSAATLAKQEGCSYDDAAHILVETGYDPVLARAIIRHRLATGQGFIGYDGIVRIGDVVFDVPAVTVQPLDPEQARQVIEAADAELDTWGPHQPGPLPALDGSTMELVAYDQVSGNEQTIQVWPRGAVISHLSLVNRDVTPLRYRLQRVQVGRDSNRQAMILEEFYLNPGQCYAMNRPPGEEILV